MPRTDPIALRRPVIGRRLRLGFVGGGRGGLVGQWHAAGARLSNQWEIVAGALSSDPETAAQSARDWLIPAERSFADWREMARNEAARPDGIDAVAICTPNHTHHDIAAGFLRAGIDVICDKPLTTTLDDAEHLVALQAETEARLYVSYPYTHHAMARQAAEMIRDGAIGRIRQVHVEYLQEWATGPADPAHKGQVWRMDPTKAGRSSAVGDIGTHAFHLLEYVTGLRARALKADFHVCGVEKALEDTAFITLRLDGDVPGLLHVTQAAPGQYCGLRFRIWGERGGLSWDHEFLEQLRHSPLDAPDQIIHRGQGAGMRPGAAGMAHLPRGLGEAVSDAWANLYSEIALSIAARRHGLALEEGAIAAWDVQDGARGVRFVETCADSHEAGGTWHDL
ncbi:Gfo/Idh/MocA family protein [Pseudoponticoccus marisrubri]|uniref:Oxidoreductase n=1 Tax=Pseudoponticoccus marisrubri TaxID=1685382 RepID=A0A0W7WNP9_9RHOB|nr:Gfo/Idh/MocA family oxidoreductase [Pseudoponticoccus marisrubri]KUF12120.1 oxidoreductase [Pseudoponticoccus marisrubri]